MSKINDLLLLEAEKYISSLMAEKLPETIVFHNFSYVKLVEQYTETIGKECGLDTDEMNLLRMAALFLNTGYINSYENHTDESIAFVTSFLTEKGVSNETIGQISGVLLATGKPDIPKDKLSEILCDANMMYVASDRGLELFDLLYEETALARPKYHKRSVFERGYIEFFTKHSYLTGYGKQILQPLKEETIRRITERMDRRKLIDSKKERSEKKKFVYSRGVDTMFRITARNQINLNSIADNKSNILISVNAIIISIIITMLAGNIGNMSQDIVPIIVFLVICLITIIIAILSTRPNIVNRRFTDEDLSKKTVDLTFFGNFIKIPYDDYQNAVKDMMTDDEHLYSTLLRNQYELGKILAKKFRLVKIAYNVFMVGIIITVIVFLVNYAVMHM